MAKKPLYKSARHLGMSAMATMAASAAHIVSYTANGSLAPDDVTRAVGAGFATVFASIISGSMGNSLSEGLEARLSDPQALLRNHHIHALTAQAVAFVIRDEKALNDTDNDRLQQLADAIVEEWNRDDQAVCLQDNIDSLVGDDLKKWFHAALDDESPTALEPDIA